MTEQSFSMFLVLNIKIQSNVVCCFVTLVIFAQDKTNRKVSSHYNF